ncbi:MAG: metallophosphoesterase [Treponema sp.]|nr:metallophosphoesterase [Treponema sp.]
MKTPHTVKCLRGRLCHLLLILAPLFLLTACPYGTFWLQFSQDGPDERAKSITELTGSELPDIGSSATYSFVVIADPHFGSPFERHDDGFVSWFTEQLESADTTKIPRFIVNVGDTLNSGSQDEADAYNEFCARIRTAAAQSQLHDANYKIYTILGNHDLYNNGWSVWKDSIYPYTSYYAFSAQADSSTSGFSYYFLDSGNGSLGNTQLTDFFARLSADSRPKIVFSHYAVYAGGIFYFTLQDTMERNLLLDAFARHQVRYVFEGHDHADHTYEWQSFSERAVPSFLYRYQCSLVTVNEASGTAESHLIDF